MSAPVHRDDQTNDLEFYAPPWARERAPSPAPDPPAVDSPAADSPTTASDSGDAEVLSLPPWRSPHRPEAADSPPPDPQVSEARADDQERSPASERPQTTPSPRMAPGVGGPNIDWQSTSSAASDSKGENASPMLSPAQSLEIEWPATSRRRPFEGDVAIKALRHRMSLDPEFLPAPPVRARPKDVLPWLSKLSLGVGVAAVVAFGIALMTRPETRLTAPKEDRGASTVVVPQLAGPQLAGISTPIPPSARLILEDRQAFTNEALPLGISLNGATGGEFALMTGLVTGTRISVGGPFGANGWRLPARDLTQALAYAPKDFVGVMDATIDVRGGSDVLVDSRLIRLEWLPKPVDGSGRQPRLDREDPVRPAAAMPRLDAEEVVRPERLAKQPDGPGQEPRLNREDPAQPAAATPSLDAEELATLIRRGQEFMRTGDIAAARLLFRRAANAGNPQAALALGATFDPVVLGELGVLGFPPDLTQARSWYDKAARLGSTEALRRIETLARAGP
jgi:hypothetical protein